MLSDYMYNELKLQVAKANMVKIMKGNTRGWNDNETLIDSEGSGRIRCTRGDYKEYLNEIEVFSPNICNLTFLQVGTKE